MSLPGHIRASVLIEPHFKDMVILALEYTPKDPSGRSWRVQRGMTAVQWHTQQPDSEQAEWDALTSQLVDCLGDIDEYDLARMLELALPSE